MIEPKEFDLELEKEAFVAWFKSIICGLSFCSSCTAEIIVVDGRDTEAVRFCSHWAVVGLIWLSSISEIPANDSMSIGFSTNQ